MPKGKPVNGFAHRHRRWNLDLLRPLHKRWLAGERLDVIARSVKTTKGRLRGAFEYYQLYATPQRTRGTLDCDSNHLVTECWKSNRSFNANAHRSSRHYKGSFDL